MRDKITYIAHAPTVTFSLFAEASVWPTVHLFSQNGIEWPNDQMISFNTAHLAMQIITTCKNTALHSLTIEQFNQLLNLPKWMDKKPLGSSTRHIGTQGVGKARFDCSDKNIGFTRLGYEARKLLHPHDLVTLASVINEFILKWENICLAQVAYN